MCLPVVWPACILVVIRLWHNCGLGKFNSKLYFLSGVKRGGVHLRGVIVREQGCEWGDTGGWGWGGMGGCTVRCGGLGGDVKGVWGLQLDGSLQAQLGELFFVGTQDL